MLPCSKRLTRESPSVVCTTASLFMRFSVPPPAAVMAKMLTCRRAPRFSWTWRVPVPERMRLEFVGKAFVPAIRSFPAETVVPPV